MGDSDWYIDKLWIILVFLEMFQLPKCNLFQKLSSYIIT